MTIMRHPSKPNSKPIPRRPADWLYQTLLILITAGIISTLFPHSPLYQPIDMPKLGDISREDVIAPFTFPILKSDEELAKETEEVASTAPLVFDLDLKATQDKLDQLEGFFQKVKGIGEVSLPESLAVLGRDYPLISPKAIGAILQKGQGVKIEREVKDLLSYLFSQGIVGSRKEVLGDKQRLIIIRNGEEGREITPKELLDLNSAREVIRSKAKGDFAQDDSSAEVAEEIVETFLFPNLKFNQKETERRVQEAIGKILPQKGLVLKNERIIGSHERVTSAHLEKLRSLAAARSQRERSFFAWSLPLVGRFLIVALVIALFSSYLYLFQRRVWTQFEKLALIAILLVFISLATYIICGSFGLSSDLVPVALVSMILAICLNAQIGIMGGVTVGLLLGVQRSFDFSSALVAIVSGAVAVYSVLRIRQRHQFYRPMLYISITYVLTIFLVETLKFSPLSQRIEFCSYGILNGFLSPLFAMGFLPIFERFFGITTDITLLELSDLNRPILRRMAIEAPGTYHHSLAVGNLAEAAAEAIGANSLLARVSSYYHDIGKLVKPDYFVENQTQGRKNPHTKLAPTMSSLVLLSHVKEGIEEARREGLPKPIIDVIQQHHGTTTMDYFYEKAKQMGADEAVRDKFRYPGPKPDTKETAIIMLADAVEAASRTLTEATPARIRGLVKKIINDKFSSGELDSCEITLRDLHLIEDSFVRVLTGMFHPRVDYPSTTEAKSRERG